MRKFRKDDLVVLARIIDQRNYPMSARIGSLAIVTEDEGAYVKVRWLDRSTAGNQADGTYNPRNFDFANAAQSKKIYAILDAEAKKARDWTPPVRDLKIGDKVTKLHAIYMGIGTIIHIHDDYAFVHFPESSPGYKSHMAYKLDEIEFKTNGDCNCD